jgi:hypothetical protein
VAETLQKRRLLSRQGYCKEERKEKKEEKKKKTRLRLQKAQTQLDWRQEASFT